MVDRGEEAMIAELAREVTRHFTGEWKWRSPSLIHGLGTGAVRVTVFWSPFDKRFHYLIFRRTPTSKGVQKQCETIPEVLRALEAVAPELTRDILEVMATEDQVDK